MTNLSWNNSYKATFYSTQYTNELEQIKTYVAENLEKLKFIRWEEIEFLLKLKWHEDSVKFLIRKNCHPSLKFYIKPGYVNIHCHVHTRFVCDRFFVVSYKSPTKKLKDFNKFYNVVEFVEYIEVNHKKLLLLT